VGRRGAISIARYTVSTVKRKRTPKTRATAVASSIGVGVSSYITVVVGL
jgi:hypothetical protein